jgi:membrane-associated phospholipid phosphatase
VHGQTIVLLAGLVFVACLAVLRTPQRVRRWIILILPVPLAILIYRWAAYRHAWTDLAAALILGLACVGLWWTLVGRRLPRPTDESIRVWTKDDPF